MRHWRFTMKISARVFSLWNNNKFYVSSSSSSWACNKIKCVTFSLLHFKGRQRDEEKIQSDDLWATLFGRSIPVFNLFNHHPAMELILCWLGGSERHTWNLEWLSSRISLQPASQKTDRQPASQTLKPISALSLCLVLGHLLYNRLDSIRRGGGGGEDIGSEYQSLFISKETQRTLGLGFLEKSRDKTLQLLSDVHLARTKIDKPTERRRRALLLSRINISVILR